MSIIIADKDRELKMKINRIKYLESSSITFNILPCVRKNEQLEVNFRFNNLTLTFVFHHLQHRLDQQFHKLYQKNNK